MALKPLPHAGFSAGELVGWRIWECHYVGGVATLRSWVYPFFWLPGTVVSDLSYDPPGMEGVPIGDYNERGVWGFKTAEERELEFKGNRFLQNNLIWGTVWMWGTVIEHDLGYRAQYARVRGLDETANGMNVPLEFLQKRYGVGASADAA